MRAALTAGLAALGLDPALCGRLEAFAGLVLERNRVMNLTAITEPSAFAGLHLLDSLSLIPLAGLSSGTVVDVGTGAGFPGVPLAIALPEGYEAHVVPRSSTFKNYGLLQANSMGVVDGSYRGDGDQWRWPAYATRDVSIPKNTRLCQFRIVENQPPLVFTRVERLGAPDRGGFGSTGR